MLNCTPSSLWTTQPLHAHNPPCTSPHFNSTPDQSWPEPNWTDPFYAIKRPLWGFKNGAQAASHNMFKVTNTIFAGTLTNHDKERRDPSETATLQHVNTATVQHANCSQSIQQGQVYKISSALPPEVN